MLRIRQGWLVVLLGVGLLAGCKKDDKSGTGSGDKTAESAGAANSATVDDLSFLPVDSQLVLGMNFAQVQQSALWKKFVEPRLTGGEAQRRIAELKAKCSIDPVSAATSFSVGIKGMGDRPSGVIVFHGLDKAKALECVDKNKDELTKDGTEMTRDGDLVLLKGKRGEQAAISFVNASTALVVFGDNADAAGVKAVAAGGSTLKSSPKFLEMYKKVNSSDSVWGLVNGKLLDRAPLPVKARAVYGSLSVTDGLALDLRVQFENPESATQAAGMLNGQAKQAQAYVDKSDFTTDGNELHAIVAMSSQKLEALISQLGGLLGAFTGGMMGTP